MKAWHPLFTDMAGNSYFSQTNKPLKCSDSDIFSQFLWDSKSEVNTEMYFHVWECSYVLSVILRKFPTRTVKIVKSTIADSIHLFWTPIPNLQSMLPNRTLFPVRGIWMSSLVWLRKHMATNHWMLSAAFCLKCLQIHLKFIFKPPDFQLCISNFFPLLEFINGQFLYYLKLILYLNVVWISLQVWWMCMYEVNLFSLSPKIDLRRLSGTTWALS